MHVGNGCWDNRTMLGGGRMLHIGGHVSMRFITQSWNWSSYHKQMTSEHRDVVTGTAYMLCCFFSAPYGIREKCRKVGLKPGKAAQQVSETQ